MDDMGVAKLAAILSSNEVPPPPLPPLFISGIMSVF